MICINLIIFNCALAVGDSMLVFLERGKNSGDWSEKKRKGEPIWTYRNTLALQVVMLLF